MACFFHADARCRGGKPVNKLGFEVMVQTGLKMACSIGRLTGQSILPTSFVTGAFELARRNLPGNKHAFTVQDFCREFMPITSNRVLHKQREAEWFDNLKYNLLPFCLSSMDCALQPLVRARKVRVAFLGFALARRCLNESVHFEFVLRRYDDQRFGSSSVSNLDSLPKILERMMNDGIDQQRLKDAMEFAVETLGVHVRTGYLMHSIEVQTGEVPNYKADRLAAFAVELQGKLVYYNVNSYYSAMLWLEKLLMLPSNSFQAYQVALLLERFGSVAQLSKRIVQPQFLPCSGPGIKRNITRNKIIAISIIV